MITANADEDLIKQSLLMQVSPCHWPPPTRSSFASPLKDTRHPEAFTSSTKVLLGSVAAVHVAALSNLPPRGWRIPSPSIFRTIGPRVGEKLNNLNMLSPTYPDTHTHTLTNDTENAVVALGLPSQYGSTIFLSL